MAVNTAQLFFKRFKIGGHFYIQYPYQNLCGFRPSLCPFRCQQSVNMHFTPIPHNIMYTHTYTHTHTLCMHSFYTGLLNKMQVNYFYYLQIFFKVIYFMTHFIISILNLKYYGGGIF